MDLEQLLPLLRCPICKSRLDQQKEILQCEDCQQQYPIIDGVPIMLYGVDSESFREKELHEDAPLSKHAYSDASLELIKKNANGLVLDLGAGAKETALPNVIQLDIFRFPQTDIVARAEALPFKDELFDGVVSQAVFEHLQFPELAAEEIHRVCKVGAEIKIDTAFLQPEHGFPNHFYNATLSGLKHWFRNFDIQWSGVEPYQHPCFALDWFLQVYINGIPEKQKTRIKQASLLDFLNALDHLAGRKAGNKAVTDLATALWQIPEPVQRTIAAGVSISAKATSEKNLKGSVQTSSSTIVAQAQMDKLEQTIESTQFQSRCWQWLWEVEQAATEVLYDHLQTRHHPLFLGAGRPLWRAARLFIYSMIDQSKQILKNIKRILAPYARKISINKNQMPFQLPPADAVTPPPFIQLVIFIDEKCSAINLLRFLCSLQKQSYSSWNCIIKSNNNTNEVIKELAWGFANRDNRFKFKQNNYISENNYYKQVFKQGKYVIAANSDTILLPTLLEEFASLAVAFPDKQAIRCRGGVIKKDKIEFSPITHALTMTRDIFKPIDSLPEDKIGNLNNILFLLQGRKD